MSLCTITTFAQNFTIKCDTSNYSSNEAPFICRYSNLFDEYLQTRIEMKKNTAYFEGMIGIVKPYFLQLTNTQLLAIPNQMITGVLKENGDIFITNDSNNINTFLLDFQNKCIGITTRYNNSTPFDRFLILYDSLHRYIDTVITQVCTTISKERYNINNEALSAIREFCTAKLGHFSLLPLLVKGAYNENLFGIIKKDIKINDPVYWLEFQSGRIFLKNYFLKIALSKNEFDVQKTLASNILFKDSDVKKYLEYHYFNSLLNSDSALSNLPAISKEFSEYENKYSFTEKEHDILQHLKSKFDLTGKNIVSIFSKQLLVNIKGKILGNEKDTLLTTKGKIIVYYWASWCPPCIQTISKLKSDEISFKGEKYKLLFISEDKSQQDWLSKKYPVLNSTNSFRLKDVKNYSFYRTFQIEAIPRLFLIDNGILINQDFTKERFEEIL